ncbi:probable quorum-quenching lactonase YtnP [Ylistrum balloti]|uniref:probable quorum-quenching lactonase YtnP n=1 Tax=Ylistrum balloti TaxID=509963 RepID=UPI002905978A|nr:probable quorum-quenching lactonase YtnP [Ylistrum balloti]
MAFDGGAFFHTIPKAIWEKKVEVSEKNMITAALNALYLEKDGKKILIEAGAGNKFSAKHRAIFHRSTALPLLDELTQIGVGREEIDYVILSHLHRDHAGTLTHYVYDTDTDSEPAVHISFPNAQHYAHSAEWDYACGGNELSSASYNTLDFLPVHEAGRLTLIQEEESEPLRGIRIRKTAAHTLGHTCIIIENDGKKVLFPSDILPTRHHLAIHWACSYDYCSYQVVEEKRKLMDMAVQEQMLVYLVHENDHPLGTIQRGDGSEYIWVPQDMS